MDDRLDGLAHDLNVGRAEFLAGYVLRQAAHDLLNAIARSIKSGREVFKPRPRIESAARIDVDADVAVFGPGMDRKVRFGDHDRPADALWRKAVKRMSNYGCPDCFRRRQHMRFDRGLVVEDGGAAAVEFCDKMASNRVQLLVTPFFPANGCPSWNPIVAISIDARGSRV